MIDREVLVDSDESTSSLDTSDDEFEVDDQFVI